MGQETNEYGQPIGAPLPNWSARQVPPRRPMEGRYTRIEPLSVADHAEDLFAAYSLDQKGILWTYMPVGPFPDLGSFKTWMESACKSNDPLFHAILDQATGKAVGFASYLRIDPPAGVIEVGFIAYSPLLQRSRVATEAMYLMMARVFDEMGYRRYEWKCDSLNAPSRQAAQRLGFTYDGLFEQATIYKGRNRDTAWFSILDRDWPQTRTAYLAWLDPANFDDNGEQRRRLAELITEQRA